MADDRLDDFVSDTAFQQFEKTHQYLIQITDDVVTMSKTAREAFSNLGGAQNLVDMATGASAATAANKQLIQSQLDFQKVVKDTQLFLNQYGGTMQMNITRYVDQNLQLKETAAAIAQTNKAYKDGAITLDQYSNRMVRLTDQQMQLKVATAESRIVINAENKERIAASDSMDAMAQRLGRLRDTYRQLSAAERESTEVGLPIKAQIAELDAEVKKLDADLGNFQRNVGNYPNAGGQLAAIKNQMVALTVAGKQNTEEYEALRVKAGELQTSIKSVGGEFTKTATVTDKFTNILERMGLRFIVNMALFQVGMDLFNAVTQRMQEDADRLNYVQTTMGEIAKNSANSFSQEAVTMETLRARFESTTSSMDDKKEVVQELNDKFGNQIDKINGINDAEKFFRDKSDAFIQAVNLRAQAEGALAVITQNTQKQIEAQANPDKLLNGWDKTSLAIKSVGVGLKSIFTGGNGFFGVKNEYEWQKTVAAAGALDQTITDTANSSDVATKKLIELQNAAQKLDTANGFNTDAKGGKEKKGAKVNDGSSAQYEAEKSLNDALTQLGEQRYKQDSDLQKSIADDEKKTLDERLTALDKFTQDQISLVILENGKEKADTLAKLAEIQQKEAEYAAGTIQLTAGQLKALETAKDASNVKLLALAEDLKTKLGEIDIQSTDERKKIIQSSEAEIIQSEESMLQTRLSNDEAAYNKDLELLQSQLLNKEINQKQYEDLVKQLKDKYNVEEDAQRVLALAAELFDANLSASQRLDIEKNLQAAKKKLRDDEIAEQKANNDKLYQGQQELSQKTVQLAQATQNVIKTLIDAAYQNRIQQDENEMTTVRQNQQDQINLVNASSANSVAKTQEVSQINAQAAVEQQQLQEDANRQKRRQAVADRTASILGIIENGAVAIVETYAQYAKVPGGFAIAAELAAVMGGIAAAQVAAVLATPLPAYAEGVLDHPGGLAMLGDAYSPEAVFEPGKAPYWSSDTPAIYNLAPHTRVVPEKDLYDANFGTNPLQLFSLLSQSNTPSVSFKQDANRIIQAINEKQETHFHWDNGQLKKSVKNGGSWTHYINTNNS